LHRNICNMWWFVIFVMTICCSGLNLYDITSSWGTAFTHNIKKPRIHHSKYNNLLSDTLYNEHKVDTMIGRSNQYDLVYKGRSRHTGTPQHNYSYHLEQYINMYQSQSFKEVYNMYYKYFCTILILLLILILTFTD
jgi:hypothetical protein